MRHEDLLGRLPAEMSLPAPRKERLKEDLMAIITEEQAGPNGPQPSRRGRRPILAATAGAVLLTAAAAWAVFQDPATTTDVQCSGHPAIDETIIDSVSGDPVADCATLWRQQVGEPPELAAYQNPQGGVVVLPIDQSVPDGWMPLGAEFRQDIQLIELEAALDGLGGGLSSGCYQLPEAQEITAGHIERIGVSDWTIASERGEADGETTCTYFYLDRGTRRVVLIPLEGVAPPADAPYVLLAERLAKITTEACLTIEETVQATLQEATNLGLDPEEPHLIIHRVPDSGASCSRTDVNVGGRIEVTVRGPSS
ncbi:MAG: hypothetical protein WD156_08865 [Acidimicrobiia bacterium]